MLHLPPKAGETLNVRIPKFSKNTAIYPKSLYLTYKFKLTTEGDETDVPDHLVNAIVENLKLQINGKTITEVNDFNKFAIYRDFWMQKFNYENMCLGQGINQSAATKKKRHDVSGATTDVLGVQYSERYRFYLGHFLTDTASNPESIMGDLEFHLKLASGKYTLEDISLEYTSVEDDELASSIVQKYVSQDHVFNDIQAHTTVDLLATASKFEIDIHGQHMSLRSILVLFKPSGDDNADLVYANPNLKKLSVNIDGKTNQLFTDEFFPEDAYKYAYEYLAQGPYPYLTVTDFYTNKYGLVIDLRTIKDEDSYDIGRTVRNYVKIKGEKLATTGALKAYVYLISDKNVSFTNGKITSIEI